MFLQKRSLLWKVMLVGVVFVPLKLLFISLSGDNVGTLMTNDGHFAEYQAFNKEYPKVYSVDIMKEQLYQNSNPQIKSFLEKIKNSSPSGANMFPCGKVTRPAESQYSNTGPYWHLHKDGKQEVMVISAVYDDRSAGGILPFIRLQVVATPAIGDHYCHLWYDGLEQPYVTKAIIQKTGRGHKVFGVHYGQLLYSCKLPTSLPIPTNVSITTKTCYQSAMIVPVYIPVRSHWEHEFGICVAIAFGQVDYPTIVEWIELHKNFGVTEFNIYNASLSDSMKTLFKYYEDKGILRVHQMPPPKPDYSKMGSKLSSPASLNDCMLKNMYRYRYMIVIDFDEFIIPIKHSNYSKMLQSIDKDNKLKESYQSYTFRNAYHFVESPPDKSEPEYLNTLRYKHRIKPSRYLFAPKSFIDPRRCLSVFNHYCFIRFPSLPGKLTIDVSPNTALSHHYRNCNLGKDKCKEHLSSTVIDNGIMKYKNFLTNRVKRVLEDVNYFKKKT